MHDRTTGSRRIALGTAMAVLACALLAVPAFAEEPAPVSAPAASPIGKAASGELYFYPCDSCHPLTPGSPPADLPVEFSGHQVVLVGHDVLAPEGESCRVCHGDPAVDPGKLVAFDGSLIDITGDTSLVCYRCHSARYDEWRAGAHGRGEPSCSAAGCHDPHTPQWIAGDPLRPFVGTGFNVRVVSERERFTPLAGPPVPAPVHTPSWLVLASGLAALVTAGVTGFLVRGRSSR